MLSLDFDIIILLILLTMITIGYVTGATVELIKLLKIVIPFLIIFYFGGYISRFVFKSPQFNSLISKVTFIQGMHYFNTLVMFLSTFIAFFGSYFIISILINSIQKRIQTEKVTYKLGKVNNVFGAIISVARFYILASILILPFYMLSITSKSDDFFTKVIMEHPPAFTRIGYIVNSSEPVLNASNSLSNFLDIVDLNKLETTYQTITDLSGTLAEYDAQMEIVYNQVDTTNIDLDLSAKYHYLSSFVANPDSYIDATNEETLKQDLQAKKVSYQPYSGLLTWAITHDLDLLSRDELVAQFNTDYNTIYHNTTDTSMQMELEKAHKASQIYVIINTWLSDELSIDTTNLTNLLNDANIELILDQLVTEYNNQDQQGLIYDLNQLGNEELNGKLLSMKTFVSNYHEIYRPIMEKMNVDLPFKYKLIAATMTKVNFVDSLKRSPLMAMYALDTIEFLNDSNLNLIPGETFYQSLIKIMIPVYMIKPDDQNVVQMVEGEDMNQFLIQIDQGIDDVILTKPFVINMLDALTTAEYNDQSTGTSELYIQYLYDNHDISQGAIEALANYHLLHETDDARAVDIIATLTEVGELNG